MMNILGKALVGYRRALVYVTASMLICSGVGHAQLAGKKVDLQKKPELPYISALNPFDFVQQEAEGLDLAAKNTQFQQSKVLGGNAQLSVKARASIKPRTALQYRRNFTASQEQSQVLYKTLVRQYGKPKSVRGQSHVWDIKNPTSGGKQADIVTVILKIANNGDYELVMDRDRGGDGRATWALPRTPKPAAKQSQQKVTQVQPILQPDND